MENKIRSKNILIGFLLFIIGLMLFTISNIINSKYSEINKIKTECSPIAVDGKTIELDTDKIIVKDLYNKVKTNIYEDINNPYFNDLLKSYLVARNLPNNLIYESNCNLFIDNKMYSHTCEKNGLYNTTAFSINSFTLEYKKLFGEDSIIKHQDIQLGNSCLGGYQYIPKRDEYVKGKCQEEVTTPYQVKKNLYKATSYGPYIYLYEDVKYIGAEGSNIPKELVTGNYKYTFKLDKNYNYILLNKELIK